MRPLAGRQQATGSFGTFFLLNNVVIVDMLFYLGLQMGAKGRFCWVETQVGVESHLLDLSREWDLV